MRFLALLLFLSVPLARASNDKECVRRFHELENARILEAQSDPEPEIRVRALEGFAWNHATAEQQNALFENARAFNVDGPIEEHTNSFVIGAYVDLAAKSQDRRWLPLINEWRERWASPRVSLSWHRFLKEKAEYAVHLLERGEALRFTEEQIYARFANLDATTDYVKGLVARGSYHYTVHSEDQRTLRRMSRERLDQCLRSSTGRVVRYLGFNPKYRNAMFRWSGENATIIFAISYPDSPLERIDVITTYEGTQYPRLPVHLDPRFFHSFFPDDSWEGL